MYGKVELTTENRIEYRLDHKMQTFIIVDMQGYITVVERRIHWHRLMGIR